LISQEPISQNRYWEARGEIADFSETARMIQKTSETLPDTITRMHGDARKTNGWLVIEKVGGGTYLIGGDAVICHADSIEFSDHDGAHVVVPYGQIIAIEIRDRH
jgi:hypothetical protein